MASRFKARLKRILLPALLIAPTILTAGGPKYVAGVTYFNPGVAGTPLHWSGGMVRYFVDQGPLSATVTNQQATAMVDTAADLWSDVPTAAVHLINAGTLSEDVSGSNVQAGPSAGPSSVSFVQPADLAPASSGFPVGVVFDADGSVIDALLGSGASDPNACQNNGVLVWIDGFNSDATISHAVLVLNGLCATTTSRLQMMTFQLERAFGRILGLDFSQVNPGALSGTDPNQKLGLPVMQPLSGACGSTGGLCISQPNQLHFDDLAALNRLYPITAANLANFPGKELTAPNTVSIHGSLTFREGSGMQGVNVVARPLDANGKPLYAYTVTAVSGVLFGGNRGNSISGWDDRNGNQLSNWGANDPALQGFFDLSSMPLPPGVSSADFQVSFEPVDPLYIDTNSVGPYIHGSPTPSGTIPVITVPALSPGSIQTLNVSIDDSAVGGAEDAIAIETAPRPVPPSGEWTGRLSQVGQADWFAFPVRANRTFTVVTQAVNESGVSTESKAMLTIGVWDGFDAAGSAASASAPALNGYAAGETFLSILSPTDDVIRLGIADMRGDGRPDYAYLGWVLYADTVSPSHLPAAGGPMVIRGMGFHPSDTVFIAGKPALITSVSSNEITAIAPPSSSGGSADVEVDSVPTYSARAVVAGGVTYDAGSGDSLTLINAPANSVPSGVPIPFTVTALASNLAPVGGVVVTYAVTSGTASLGCGQSQCTVATSGDGMATLPVTATGTSPATVTASLANGASLQAHFTGGTPPTLSALTPSVSVAVGATVTWTVQALVLKTGVPIAGQSVVWQTGVGVLVQGSNMAVSSDSGIAVRDLTVGPLSAGQQVTATACVNGTSNCAIFTATGSRTEFASIQPVSGATQSFPLSGSPSQIVMRLRDMNGSPMAGGTVTLYQALYAWSPPCPPQGRCAAAQLLSSQTSIATSAIDGSVIFIPASLPAIATSLVGLATAGNSSSAAVSIERRPY